MRSLTRILPVVLSLIATTAGAAKVNIPVEGANLNVAFQLQPWFVLTDKSAPDGQSASPEFYLKRARVVINGDMANKFSFLVQIDNPNFGRRGNLTGRVLIQDAWVAYSPTGHTGGSVVFIDAGLLLLPIARQLLQSTTSFTTIDVHTDAFRGMRETAALRDLGVSVRGWALEKRIGFRGGIYGGLRGTPGEPSPSNPFGGLNPKGHPRLAGFVNFNIIGSEEGGWLYQGIYFTDKPIVSVGVGGVYQSLSTRGPNGVTDSRVFSADVFADIPIVGTEQELILHATAYRNDYGTGSRDTGWGFFSDLGYRYGAFMPYVSYQFFGGDRCPPTADVCSEANTADSRIFKVGLDYFINKNLNHVKAELAWSRSLVTLNVPSTWSATVQWNFNF